MVTASKIKYLRVPDTLLDAVKEEQTRAREAGRSARGAGPGPRGTYAFLCSRSCMTSLDQHHAMIRSYHTIADDALLALITYFRTAQAGAECQQEVGHSAHDPTQAFSRVSAVSSPQDVATPEAQVPVEPGVEEGDDLSIDACDILIYARFDGVVFFPTTLVSLSVTNKELARLPTLSAGRRRQLYIKRLLSVGNV